MIFLTSLVSVSFAKNEGKNVAAAKSTQEVKGTVKPLATSIRERQRERLMIAIEKCEGNNIDKGKCEEKLRNRLELVDKLGEKDLQRIEKIKEKRIEMIQGLNELKQKNSFRKFSEDGFKARIVSQQKLAKARLDYVKAKESYLNAKKGYVNAKINFLSVKEELKKCKGKDSEECAAKRKLIRQNSKEYLLYMADLILKELDKIKNKIESSEDLSEEETSELLNTISEKTAKVEEAKAVIEALNEESSKEEVQEASKLLKKGWFETKDVAKRATGKLVNARIGGIIVKSKQLEIKLNRILGRMVEQGKDTSKVEGLVEDFNSILESARANYEKAVEKYNEARLATQDVDGIIKEAHSYMKQAHVDLKDAHRILKDIFKELKQDGFEEELISEENLAEEVADEGLAGEEAE